jgi:proline racemase
MLLSDPRGSVNSAVNLVTPAISREADFGMIVIESDFYPPMSGSNLMCTVTVVLETGMIPMTEPFTHVSALIRQRAWCVSLHSAMEGNADEFLLITCRPSYFTRRSP